MNDVIIHEHSGSSSVYLALEHWRMQRKKERDRDREVGGGEFERDTIAVKKCVGRLLAPRNGDFVTGSVFPLCNEETPHHHSTHCVYSFVVSCNNTTLCEVEVGNL